MTNEEIHEMNKEYISITKSQLIRIIRTTYKSGQLGLPVEELVELYSTLFDVK